MITSIFHVDPQFPSRIHPIYFTAHPLSPASTCDCHCNDKLRHVDFERKASAPYSTYIITACPVSHPTRATAAGGDSASESRVIFVAEGLSHIHETPQKAGLLFITRVA